ncbi:MAG TPA: hypothetical protein VIE63_03895 [Ramlibacter sp.]|jgi:uncharacterized protein (DUF697 family)
MATALDLARDDPALLEAVRRCRKLLNRRAIVAAAASTVPIPGLDWAVDAGLMSRLIPDINEEFGLTPRQIDLLPDAMREEVQKALALVGSVAVGKYVSRELILRLAKAVGRRLTAQQAAKYVPIAGQAVSAVLGYSAMRYLGEEHIKDCVRVVQQAQLALPAPSGHRATRRKVRT